MINDDPLQHLCSRQEVNFRKKKSSTLNGDGFAAEQTTAARSVMRLCLHVTFTDWSNKTFLNYL